jgi:hypothetical protein
VEDRQTELILSDAQLAVAADGRVGRCAASRPRLNSSIDTMLHHVRENARAAGLANGTTLAGAAEDWR